MRSKAVYALSGTLKHSRRALQIFGEEKGWAILQRAMSGSVISQFLVYVSNHRADSSLQVRRKTVFLVSSLLLATNPSSTPSTSQNDYLHTAPFPNDPPPDPEAQDTAQLTRSALADPSLTHTESKNTLLETIVSELCSPTPHGPNGDGEPLYDPDLQENLARCLANYIRVGGKLNDESKKRIRESVNFKLGGDGKLGLDQEDLSLLL